MKVLMTALFRFFVALVTGVKQKNSSAVCRNTLLDLHNSSDDTQPHLKIVNYRYVNNGNRTEGSAIWSEIMYMILKSEFESKSQVRFPANQNYMKQLKFNLITILLKQF